MIESIPPAEQKAWNIYFTQALNIVHEVSPTTSIGDIFAAAYRQFQSQKWMIPFVAENITNNLNNKVDESNNVEQEDTKSISTPKRKPKSAKKKVSTPTTPTATSTPRKLNTYQLFVKYYREKMSNDNSLAPQYKMKIINERWKKMSDEDKVRFLQKHGHHFDNK